MIDPSTCPCGLCSVCNCYIKQLAGMAHRHTPPIDDERPEDQQEQDEQYFDSTNTKD